MEQDGAEMTQFRTIDLEATSYQRHKAPLRAYAPPAELLSQMLHNRHHSNRPAKARESIAADAYASTARAAVLRLPAGYRRTVIV
jgi:hypothetical protein